MSRIFAGPLGSLHAAGAELAIPRFLSFSMPLKSTCLDELGISSGSLKELEV